MRSEGNGSSAKARLDRDVMLVLLALGAGVVDAISLVTLGVFTAAVTANVVLVGLALGEADSPTALRAAVAIAGFAVGVLIATRALGPVHAADRWPSRSPAVLAGIALVQVAFLVGWIASEGRPDGVVRDLLTGASAVAMGGQSAAARAWHTGIATTYVSGTLTALLHDLAARTGSRPEQLRRLSVIVAVAGGATLGALMLSHAHDAVAIVPAALTVVVAIGALALPRRRARANR